MKKIFVFIFWTISTLSLFAHTGGDVEYTCPLCNTKFESYTQFSGTSFGQNLDLRRYGAIMIPSPIPKCPNCNLVFDNDFFTEIEISRIRNELIENNIFENNPGMPNYYYLAREAEIVGRNLDNIIWWFLSAVWENKDATKKTFLINVTIEYIDKLNETDNGYNNCQLIKLDLLRRSGRFDEATELIEKIKINQDFYKDYIARIVDLQIELIRDMNQEEHRMP